jgi:DnaJ-class molecular chaperone
MRKKLPKSYIDEAYDVLCDMEKHTIYDHCGCDGLKNDVSTGEGIN